MDALSSSSEQEEIWSSGTLLARLESLPMLHMKLIVLLGLSLLLDGLDTLSISVLLLPIGTEFHVSPANTGILIAAGFMGQALGAVIFGSLSERYGRKMPLVVALIIAGGFSIGAALASSVQILLLIRLVQGIGLGACPPLATALFNEYIPAHRRGLGGILLQACFSFGYILAPFLALLLFALIGPGLGWRVIFLIGALPLLCGILVFLFAPESVRWLILKKRTSQAEKIVSDLEQKAKRRGYHLVEVSAHERQANNEQLQTRLGELFSTKYRSRTGLTWTIWFTSFFVLVGFSSWLPSLYINPGGLSQTHSLWLTAAFGIGTLSILTCYALTSDRLGRKRWFVMGLLLATCGASLGALLIGPLHMVNWISLALSGTFMNIGAYVCVSGIYVYTSELFPTRMRAWALSTGRSLSCIASIIAPIIIGTMVNQNFSISIVFCLLGIVALFGLLIVLYRGEETKKQVLETISQ